MADPIRPIPDITTTDRNLAGVLEAIKEIIEVREGTRGDSGRRFISYDDLLELLAEGGITTIISAALPSSILLRSRYQIDFGEQFTISSKEHLTVGEEYIIGGELVITGSGRLNII